MFSISDYDELQIYITDGWREWYIPKFRLTMVVDEPFLTLYWTDTEKGREGITRVLEMDYQDTLFGYSIPASASNAEFLIERYITSSWDGLVNSVTGLNTDNTDPQNPIVKIAVDGVTITGQGTLADPLVAHAAGGANLWAYKAKTTITTGDPTSGHLIWDNASQILATQLNLSHLTDDGFDIDLYFPYIVTGDTLIVQDRNDSTNFQIWTVSGAVTIIPNSYVEVPVTLSSSGGTGTTNFPNNHELLVAKFGATITITTDGVYTDGDGSVLDPINLTAKSQAAINVFNHISFI